MRPYLIVALAVLFAGLMADAVLAAMPEAPPAPEPPALVVLFDASSARLPQAEIRAAIGRELGCAVRDVFDSRLGVVVVQVHQNEIVVGYQPPAGELERKLPVAAGARQLPLLVALVAENLVYRDAGIAVPVTPAGASDAAIASVPSEPERTTPSPRVPEVVQDHPSKGLESRAPSVADAHRARVDLAARFGAFGRVSGSAGASDGQPSLGLTARINLPVVGRLRLGAEGGVARLSTNPLAQAVGSNARLGRFWIGHVSVGPSVVLTRQGASTEIELSSGIGMTYPFAIGDERADEQQSMVEGAARASSRSEYHGEFGYRVAGALGFRRWFGARWALHGAVGVEHHRLIASRTTIESGNAAPTQQNLEAVRWTEPTVQAGASLRF